MHRHLTPAEIRETIKRQAAEHQSEAIYKATNDLIPQIFASLALAIMRDKADPRTDEDKGEYIQDLFARTLSIWQEAADTGQARSYRLILKELKDDYGIEVQGLN